MNKGYSFDCEYMLKREFSDDMFEYIMTKISDKFYKKTLKQLSEDDMYTILKYVNRGDILWPIIHEKMTSEILDVKYLNKYMGRRGWRK